MARIGVTAHWTEPVNFQPFWAVTKHADIMEIEKQNDLFINEPRTIYGHSSVCRIRRNQTSKLIDASKRNHSGIERYNRKTA